MHSFNGIAAIVYAYPKYVYLNAFCCFSRIWIELDLITFYNSIYRKKKERLIYSLFSISCFYGTRTRNKAKYQKNNYYHYYGCALFHFAALVTVMVLPPKARSISSLTLSIEALSSGVRLRVTSMGLGGCRLFDR